MELARSAATDTAADTRTRAPGRVRSGTPPSADFPFESKYMDVLGSKMHYIDEGEGEPIIFLHGNPTSSYLWRNVIPHVSDQARCIAVDLIGMGKSDRPDIAYRYDDHYRYLSAFIDGLGLEGKVTLVIHDWGSALGFRWAHDHADRVRGIAMMDAMVRTLTWADLPGSLKYMMRILRRPFFGWLLAGVANLFVRKMLPDLTYGPMSAETRAYYLSLYPTVASRRAVYQWPAEIPLEGAPADNHAVVEGYHRWLTQTDMPMLMFHGNQGVAIKGDEVAWARANFTHLQTIDLGDAKHFVQETHPDAIGQGIARWFARLPETTA